MYTVNCFYFLSVPIFVKLRKKRPFRQYVNWSFQHRQNVILLAGAFLRLWVGALDNHFINVWLLLLIIKQTLVYNYLKAIKHDYNISNNYINMRCNLKGYSVIILLWYFEHILSSTKWLSWLRTGEIFNLYDENYFLSQTISMVFIFIST